MLAHVYRPVLDEEGRPLVASIQVVEPGTTDLISETLYSDADGMVELTNPFNANAVDFYLDSPKRVDVIISAPSSGDYTIDGIDVLANINLQRQTAEHTTAIIGDTTEVTFELPLGLSWRLIKIETNEPARVRIYATDTQRTADEARALEDAPEGDHGLYFEAVTDEDILEFAVTPQVLGSNLNEPPTTDAYLALQNISGSSAAITLTLTYAEIES